MYPNYNYYPPQQQPKPQVPPYLKGRPVSSLEEVRAIPIDFDGSIFYFPDIANRRIYTKQINLDGTATINMYEYKSIQQQELTPMQDTSVFITREEFNKAIEELKNLNPTPAPKAEVKF